MKAIILFVLVIIFGGIAGYLYYLWFEKKNKERLNKKESILISISTFIAIATAGFFITFTENYLYMLLIFITVIVSTSFICGLLLRCLRAKKKHMG